MQGFNTDEKRPTPVRVSLEVGSLMLMDFLVIHAGMPFTSTRNLRGHMYWAQVAGRDGEEASDHSAFVWGTYHKLFPGWRFICVDRARFE